MVSAMRVCGRVLAGAMLIWCRPATAASIPPVDHLGREAVVGSGVSFFTTNYQHATALHVGVARGLSLGMLAAGSGSFDGPDHYRTWEARISHRPVDLARGYAIGYTLGVGADLSTRFERPELAPSTYVEPCALFCVPVPALEGFPTRFRALVGMRLTTSWSSNRVWTDNWDEPGPPRDFPAWVFVPELAVEVARGCEVVVGGGGVLGLRVVR